MEVVKPSFLIELMPSGEEALKTLELYGRVAYKSEERITPESAKTFVKTLVDRQHESVLEHCSAIVRFICDRGISHELVRHRLCSFTQESTRYVNYGKRGLQVICPPELEGHALKAWTVAVEAAERSYNILLSYGVKPQIARALLPHCAKTELVVTANFRQWRHIFKMRCAKSAHPQMRELMVPLLEEFKRRVPIVFDDLTTG
jgi:thymidylate synthase (FAD)